MNKDRHGWGLRPSAFMRAYRWCPLLFLGAAVAGADTVTLRSGAVLRGEIVGEDAYEVRIVVGRTAAGDVQTVKVVAQSSVAGLERGVPDVAVEADPVPEAAAGDPAASAPLPDAGALREAVKRADALTGAGRHDEAVAAYEAVIDVVERGAVASAGATTPEARAARLALLQVERDAYAHLQIALRGRLDLRRETLRAADESARDLERRLAGLREERDGLRNPDRERDKHRSLGETLPRAGSVTDLRKLEDAIAQDEARLAAHEAWGREERIAIVGLENEIALVETKADAAEDRYRAAERAQRGRQ